MLTSFPVVRHTLVGLAVVVALASDAALAQDRVFTSPGPGARPAEVGAIGHFGTNLGARPDWVLGSLGAGGQFVVQDRGATQAIGGEERAPVIRATFTNTSLALPTGYLLTVDAIRPRVFLLRGADVVMIDLQTATATTLTTALPVPYSIGTVTLSSPPEAQFAQNAERLFVRRRNAAGNAGELAVVDVNAAQVVRSLPDPSTRYGGLSYAADSQWLVDPNAVRVFGHNGSTVTVMDASVGTTIATTAVASIVDLLGAVPFAALMPDWSHQRVYAVQGQPNNWTVSMVESSGTLAAEVPQRGYCLPQLRVSPHTGRGYFLFNTGGGGKYYGPIFTSLMAFDAATLAVRDVVDVTTAFGFSTDLCQSLPLSLVTVPGPPAGLQASVTNRDVRLSWTNVGDASGFVIDAGMAPGVSMLSVPVGLTQSVTFRDVPPGRYYLRVRGGNAFGGGRASNEVVVVVP